MDFFLHIDYSVEMSDDSESVEEYTNEELKGIPGVSYAKSE